MNTTPNRPADPSVDELTERGRRAMAVQAEERARIIAAHRHADAYEFHDGYERLATRFPLRRLPGMERAGAPYLLPAPCHGRAGYDLHHGRHVARREGGQVIVVDPPLKRQGDIMVFLVWWEITPEEAAQMTATDLAPYLACELEQVRWAALEALAHVHA